MQAISGERMATKVDTFLKASIAASVLIASASIAYYYLHYLPQRDAQVDRIRQMEQARIKFSRQAEQARLIEEKASPRETGRGEGSIAKSVSAMPLQC
jgi:hypothetical protein